MEPENTSGGFAPTPFDVGDPMSMRNLLVNRGAGMIVPEDFPEELGGRPTGRSRRKIRMQEEWDKKRERQLAEYKIMQDAYNQDRSFYFQERDQAMQEAKFGREQAEFEASRKLKDQIDYEAGAFIQGFNNLDPRSPEYTKGIADLRKQFPVGSLDPRVNQIVQDYNGIHKVYMDNIAERQSDAEAMRKEMQGIAKVAEQTGMPMSSFVTTDPNTGMDVINYEALGRAEGTLARKKAAGEDKDAEPRYGGKTQKEIEALITSVSADLAEAEVAGDPSKIEGLKAKQKYYQGLLPKENNDVANPAENQYIPVDQREAGKVYPTPQGDLKWTGTGWVKP